MDNNAIRHELQLKARELLTQFHQCSKTDKIALTTLAAAIECYLEIRKQLVPYIATDGYIQELAGLTFKIVAAIKQLDNPPAQTPAQAGQQFYSVMVRVEFMDCLGTSSQICDTFVLVQAPNPQAASKAAVAWHSEHPVVHADDLDSHSQSSFNHCDRAGHTSWNKSRGIRYSSIVVLSLSPDDAFHFKCMTTGLMNARLVIA